MLGFEMVGTLQNLHIHRKVLLIPLGRLPNGPQHKVEFDIRLSENLHRCLDGKNMSGGGHRGNRGGQRHVARCHIA